jgi:hypothetical protein
MLIKLIKLFRPRLKIKNMVAHTLNLITSIKRLIIKILLKIAERGGSAKPQTTTTFISHRQWLLFLAANFHEKDLCSS